MLSSFFRSDSVSVPDPGPDGLQLQYCSLFQSPFFCIKIDLRVIFEESNKCSLLQDVIFFKNSNFCFWRLRFFQIDGKFPEENPDYRKFVRIK